MQPIVCWGVLSVLLHVWECFRCSLLCVGECCQSYSMYGSVLGATYCVLGSASLTPCMGVF